MGTAEIVAELNAYEGDNIWQEVILLLGDYDDSLTDEIDQGQNDSFATAYGAVIRYDHPAKRWYVSNLTLSPVSEHDISQLRDEAGSAGDSDQVTLCDKALAGDADAWAECRTVIRVARDRA